MKVDQQTLIEFEKYQSFAQQMQTTIEKYSDPAADADRQKIFEELSKDIDVLSESLEVALQQMKDVNIREISEMLGSLLVELKKFFNPSVTADSAMIKQYEKLNANLQGRILVVISAVNDFKNPSLGNKVAKFLAKITDRFRV